MSPATFRVVLDANVLFPFSLRDTLLRAAAAGYFQPYWSDEILEEARRNLVGRGVIDETRAARLFSTMRAAFPESMVKGYEQHLTDMLNDEKDRHVAAVAVEARARIIVTFNLKDFRHLPEGVEAQSPGKFLTDLLDLDPVGIIQTLRVQAAALTRPTKTFDQLLAGLTKTVPGFVVAVRAWLALNRGDIEPR